MATPTSPLNTTLHGAAAPPPQLQWHSPIPYLFGGLAAMLALIAFALLILACSYWKLSGYLDGGADRDPEAGDADDVKSPAATEEKILVIMAGQAKPTYLATPSSSRSSSFGDSSRSCGGCAAGGIERLSEMADVEKQSCSGRFREQSLSVLAETTETTH